MLPVIAARGLVKRYGRVPAVDGVDLEVAAGERVALLGANGAGKSTTLFMLLGLVAPDAGRVEVAGHRYPAGRRRAMEAVGFAAGYLPLPDRLRVRESLGVFARLAGVADVAGAVAAGLARFGIAHLADRMGRELSSGQRTLAGVAKATLHRPRLLVLDEPTASLDPHMARRLRAGLEQVCDADATTLLVTSHDMTDVERLCRRVVFLSAGRVVADGPPGQVAARFGRDNLEDVFVHLASEDDR